MCEFMYLQSLKFTILFNKLKYNNWKKQNSDQNSWIGKSLDRGW